jgi:hypothetical protein
MTRRRPSPRWMLRGPAVREIVDRAHFGIGEFAAELRISKSYWSALSSGRVPTPPRLRRALLAHPVFAGVAPEELWEIKPPRFEQLVLPGVTVDDQPEQGAA